MMEVQTREGGKETSFPVYSGKRRRRMDSDFQKRRKQPRGSSEEKRRPEYYIFAHFKMVLKPKLLCHKQQQVSSEKEEMFHFCMFVY